MLNKIKNWFNSFSKPKSENYECKLSELETKLNSTDRFSINPVSKQILELRNGLGIETRIKRIAEIERDYKHYLEKIARLKTEFRGKYETAVSDRDMVGKYWGSIAGLNLEYQDLLRVVIDDTRTKLESRAFIRELSKEKTKEIKLERSFDY